MNAFPHHVDVVCTSASGPAFQHDVLLAPRGAASLLMLQHCPRHVWSLPLVDPCSSWRHNLLSNPGVGAAALRNLELDDPVDVIGNYSWRLPFAVRNIVEPLDIRRWGILGSTARVLLLPGTGRFFPHHSNYTHIFWSLVHVPARVSPLATVSRLNKTHS